MANLAIKGSKTRGGEIIEILEHMGGKNTQEYCGGVETNFYAIKNGEIVVVDNWKNYYTLTIDEFEERFPFKIGDTVMDVDGDVGEIINFIYATFCNFDVWPSAEYNIFDVVKELGEKVWFVDLGSVIRASMCVANGEFCFTIFPGTIGKYCDLAAVKIIVEEAGGKVTDLFGNEQKYDKDINGAIISNNVSHNEIVSTVKKYLNNRLEG